MTELAEHPESAELGEPMVEPGRLDREGAELLAARICAAAGRSAVAEAELIDLIGRFEAGGGTGWMMGAKSLAHWLGYSCSMSPGTAREHVRVSRALRRMPTVAAAFRDGRLSYSKVREVTRVVDDVDEQRLCELALTATAAQLARTLRAYRSSAGLRMAAQEQRSMSWTERSTGVIDFRVRLPKEEAAILIAALTSATDQFAPPPSAPTPGDPTAADPTADRSPDQAVDQAVDQTPAYRDIDAMLDVARGFLAASPEDRSGEDRTLVVVEVAAEQLGLTEHGRADQAAGDHTTADQISGPTATDEGVADVPAGTPDEPTGTAPAPLADPICQVRGLGGIATDTARKLACDAQLLGAVTTGLGDVLHLGRSRRLVSPAQRRALMIRDQGVCQFPGCLSGRHLRAHHLIHWADGGPTDIENLILLCQWHHTAVHEGGMTIHPLEAADGASRAHRWEFRLPSGRPYEPLRGADALVTRLAPTRDEVSAITDGVDSWHHPDATRIRPSWAGEQFDLADAVSAVFGWQLGDRAA